MEFKDILSETRRAKGLSQEALAERIGVSRQAVSKWETGEASPDLPKLLALADALEISLDALCGRTAPPAAEPERAADRPQCLPRWLIALIAALICIPLAILLLNVLPAGLFGFLADSQQETESGTVLPELLTVDGVSYRTEEGTVICTFIPGAANDRIEYTLTYSPESGSLPTVTVPAERLGAVCRGGGAALADNVRYTVAVSASAGNDVRTVVIGSVTLDGGAALWSGA